MVAYMHDSVVSATDDTCPPVAWKNVLAVKRALFTAEDIEVFVSQSLHLQLQAL